MLNAFRSSTSTYSTLRLLQWLWNILRHHRLQTGLNTLLGCSTVLLDFMFIAATKWTIDIATYKAPGSLFIAAALLIGILLSQLCIHFASRWVKAILGVKAQNHMQRFYFDRLLHSEWKDRNRRHSGDLLNRLERDVTDVVNASPKRLLPLSPCAYGWQARSYSCIPWMLHWLVSLWPSFRSSWY